MNSQFLEIFIERKVFALLHQMVKHPFLLII